MRAWSSITTSKVALLAPFEGVAHRLRQVQDPFIGHMHGAVDVAGRRPVAFHLPQQA